jgi:DNA-binding NtrC family response regulator
MIETSAAPECARILVVEDNDELRNLVVRALIGRGYAVESAADGDKGSEAMRRDRFDLLLTDLIMPGQEGIELILAARSCSPGLKIVAMSGGSLQNGHDYLPLASKLGAAAVLAKPFSLPDLLGTVSQVIKEPAPREKA